MEDRFKFRCFDTDIKKYIIGFELSVAWRYPNSIIEQCTGLRDKKNRLIWEGDIVNYKNSDTPKKGILFQIVWDKYTARWALYGIYPFISRQPYAGLTPSYLKIVGNIHENPELWEEAKNGIH